MTPDKWKMILESKVEELPGVATDVFVKPLLQKIVDDSTNKFDDVGMVTLYAPLRNSIIGMFKTFTDKLKV